MANTSTQALMNWSGGKDSTLALHHILHDQSWKVTDLLTTTNADHGRVTMHGVRDELIVQQAERLGLPLHWVSLSAKVDMDAYDQQMRTVLGQLSAKGLAHSIFGDIFLEDLRSYRENKAKEIGWQCHFPLWQRDTTELAHEFIALGYEATLVCVNERLLGPDFIGRKYDLNLLNDLPDAVDPCGENGEFHTLVTAGPIYGEPIPIRLGEQTVQTYPASTPEQESSFRFIDVEMA